MFLVTAWDDSSEDGLSKAKGLLYLRNMYLVQNTVGVKYLLLAPEMWALNKEDLLSRILKWLSSIVKD